MENLVIAPITRQLLIMMHPNFQNDQINEFKTDCKNVLVSYERPKPISWPRTLPLAISISSPPPEGLRNLFKFYVLTTNLTKIQTKLMQNQEI